MQPGDIPDDLIPTADPQEVVQQYSGWVKRIANRYYTALERTGVIDLDDLFQVGCMAILRAQKAYDPNGGSGFLNFSSYYIRSAIRCELGFKADGTLPEQLVYLDEKITEDADDTRLDILPDPSPTAEEAIIEQDIQQEIAEAVRAAVDRLKNAKQREIITRCWLEGQDKQSVADDMGIKLRALQSVDTEARHKLRRDIQLKQYAIPFFNVSLGRFNTTWTSAVEAAAIWREEHGYTESGKEAAV